MWPRRSEALFIGLSTAQMSWQFADRPPQAATLAGSAGPFEPLATTLQAASMPARCSALHVVAGSSVARHWLQTPPPGLRSLSELRALVQSRADQLFGSAPGWTVAADWHATRPFLCAAWPGDLGGLVSEAARERGASLHLGTSLCAALSQHAGHLPAEGWAVLNEPEALHVLYFSAGRLAYIRTVTVSIDLRGAALERAVAAEVARSAALAGGLPTDPIMNLHIGGSMHATQSDAALSLATQPHGFRSS